jgi:hypothetical protein
VSDEATPKRSLFPTNGARSLLTALLVPAVVGGVAFYVGGAVQEERIASLQESFRAHRGEGHSDTNRELVALQTRFEALTQVTAEVRDELRQLRAKVEAMDARGRGVQR